MMHRILFLADLGSSPHLPAVEVAILLGVVSWLAKLVLEKLVLRRLDDHDKRLRDAELALAIVETTDSHRINRRR